MTEKIQLSYFMEVRKGLFTGEETSLDMLLDGVVDLGHDIQENIISFVGEEPEHPYFRREDFESYIYYHDVLNNEYAFPVDHDEKHCFDALFDDDFVIDII